MVAIYRHLVVFVFVLALAFTHAPVRAQINYINEPPIQPQIDENGVNVATGALYLTGTQASIGPTDRRPMIWSPVWMGNGWRHNFVISLTILPANKIRVDIGGTATTFSLVSGNYVSDQGDGSILEAVGGDYRYTARDGTKVYIALLGPGLYQTSYPLGYAAKSITYPDGEVVDLTYVRNLCGMDSSLCWQLSSALSSRGYQISYSYGTTRDYPWRPAKIVFLNRTIEYCDPEALPCTVASSWPNVQYSYYASGTNIQAFEQDPAGNSTRYTTNSARQLIGIKRPMSSADDITIAYDGAGRVQTLTRDGATFTYGYTDVGGVRTMTMSGPLGTARTVMSQIATGWVTADKNALNQTTSYDHDSFGRIIKVTQPEGNYTEYTYDARGNVLATTWVSKTPGTPANVSVSAAFDSGCANRFTCNQPNTTTDASGNVTSYAYDPAHGGALTITSPAVAIGSSMIQPQKRFSYGQLSAWFKDASGNLAGAPAIYVQLTASECQAVASCVGTSDEARSTNIFQTGSPSVSSNILLQGSVAGSGTSPSMTGISFTYDDIGNRITTTDALGADTHIFYNANRQATGRIGPEPDSTGPLKRRATRYTYNGNSLITRTDQGTANGTSSTDLSSMAILQFSITNYDAYSRPVEQASFDAAGHALALTQTGYDTLGRAECVAQRMNLDTYGALPGACVQTKPLEMKWDRIDRYTYDEVSRITVVQSAHDVPGTERNTRTSIYTANGKLATLKDAANNLTTYEYDGLDRLWRTRFPSKTVPNTSSTTDYEELGYDPGSRVSAKRLRDAHSIGFNYDALNRLTGRTYSPGNNNANVGFGYDLMSRRTSAARGNSGFQTTNAFAYDALSRLTSQTASYGASTPINPKTFTYGYDPVGRRTSMDWGDGFYATYSYLATGELKTAYQNGAAWIADFGYDDLGNRTWLQRTNSTVTYYHYDGISRLDSLQHDFPDPAADQILTFEYNPASQITKRTSANGRYAFTQSYNFARAYTANGLDQYSSAGGQAITYDDRGNLTYKGNANYSYNDDNELTTKDSQRFDYDALGRLTYSTATGIRFGYDNTDLIAEYDASGNLLRRYVHGDGIDEPLLWYEGGDRRFLHADERGSIIAISPSYSPRGVIGLAGVA